MGNAVADVQDDGGAERVSEAAGWDFGAGWYPIVWTDVMTPFGTSAAVDSPIAVFGALSFWWLGEHGVPRIDTSSDVFFANDQLAVRFIEEVDFDYVAVDATAAMITAAS